MPIGAVIGIVYNVLNRYEIHWPQFDFTLVTPQPHQKETKKSKDKDDDITKSKNPQEPHLEPGIINFVCIIGT